VTALILHIPHASRLIPSGERGALLPDDATLSQELLRMSEASTSVRLNARELDHFGPFHDILGDKPPEIGG
jgi:hypothetical protein